MTISNSQSVANPDVTVRACSISGLGPDIINYFATGGHFNGGADAIRLIGSNTGADVFNVQSTLVGSQITIESLGDDDTFNVSSDAPLNFGNVTGLLGPLSIDAGRGSNNRLVVSNWGGGSGLNTVLTSDQIFMEGLAPIHYVANGGNFSDPVELIGSDPGDDFFEIDSTLAGSSYVIDGLGGNDRVVIGNGDLDAIEGAVTVFGGAGSDQITVDDSGNSKRVDYLATPESVTSAAQKGQPARSFAGITFDGTSEDLELDGSNAANTFDVTPSSSTAFLINGNLPAPGTVPPRLGDYLRVNFSGVTCPFLSIDPTTRGSGNWQFGSGQMPIRFVSIERFNGVERDALFSESGAFATSALKVFNPANTLEMLAIPGARVFGDVDPVGVIAVTGDLNGDGIPDVAVGPETAYNPTVKVFDGIDGHLLWQLNPYADKPKIAIGLKLAIGDVNGDGWNDLVVGAGFPAASPVPMRAFDGNPNGRHGRIGSDFFAFGKYSLSGISTSVADQDVEGPPNSGQIVAAALVNGVPTVRSFVLSGNQFVQVPGSQFQPFGNKLASQVSLTAGDVNGDGAADVIVSEEVGTKVMLGAFDAAGHVLTPVFTASSSAAPVEPTFLTAHDVDGDGTTDFVSAFQSTLGITGNVAEFSLSSGSPVRQYSANVGYIADLSGVWDDGGQLVTISQNGQNIAISGGGLSQGYLLAGVNVLVAQGNKTVKVATLDHEVLRWINGTTWEKVDLAGLYSDGGNLARIQQRGSQLWMVNGTGKFSIGEITSTGTLSADNFALKGTIGLGEIDWSDGTKWTKIALADQYLVGNKAAQVIQDGTTTVLVSPAGQTSAVRFLDPTHFIALDWGNLAGQVLNGGLLFANGQKWFKAETSKGADGLLGVSVQASGTKLTFVDKFGKKHFATPVAANRVQVAGLGMATIENGQIVFDSGLVWTGFDRNQLAILVGDFGLPALA